REVTMASPRMGSREVTCLSSRASRSGTGVKTRGRSHAASAGPVDLESRLPGRLSRGPFSRYVAGATAAFAGRDQTSVSGNERWIAKALRAWPAVVAELETISVESHGPILARPCSYPNRLL